MTPTFEELLDDLISAARSTPGFGDPDTIDIEDAKKACMAFFNQCPATLHRAPHGPGSDDECVVVLSCKKDLSLQTEVRAYVNYKGGVCECCSSDGDSIEDLRNDEDRLLLELAIHVDEKHPDIVAFKERVRAHHEDVRVRMEAHTQAEHVHNEPGFDDILQAALNKPVLKALLARKRDRKS